MTHKAPTQMKSVTKERFDYTNDIVGQSRRFSSTFLDMHSLVKLVADQVFSRPQLGIYIAAVALLLALTAVIIPLGYYVYADQNKAATAVSDLQNRVDALEKRK